MGWGAPIRLAPQGNSGVPFASLRLGAFNNGMGRDVMATLVHFFPASAAWLGSPSLRFVCSECDAQVARPVEDVVRQHGEDCTIGQVVADAFCRRCGSPFIVAFPDDEDDDEVE